MKLVAEFLNQKMCGFQKLLLFGANLQLVPHALDESNSDVFLTGGFIDCVRKGTECKIAQQIVDDDYEAVSAILFLQKAIQPDAFYFCYHTVDLSIKRSTRTTNGIIHKSACKRFSDLLSEVLVKHKTRMIDWSVSHLAQDHWPVHIKDARKKEADHLHVDVNVALQKLQAEIEQLEEVFKERRRLKRYGPSAKPQTPLKKSKTI